MGLGDPEWTDAQLIDAMLRHPILINRPIVVTPLGTRLCRPSEVVLDILPRPQQGHSPRRTAKPSSTRQDSVWQSTDLPDPALRGQRWRGSNDLPLWRAEASAAPRS